MGRKFSHARSKRIRTMAIFIALVTFQLTNRKYAVGHTAERRNQSDAVGEFFLSNIPNVCPKLGSCINRPEGVNSDSVGGNSCCQCSCNDYCHSFNNCCPDKEDSAANPETIQSWQTACLSPLPNILKALYMKQLVGAYWVVVKCPRQFKNDTLKGKCENPSLFILEESLPVVFADDGEIIFRNKFCALCNEYYHWTEWNVIYSINQDYLQQTNIGSEVNIDTYTGIASGDEKFIGWDVLFIPPFDKPSFAFRCFKSVEILDCNVTGNWEKYDWLIDKACSYTHLPYLKYKNPYCAICNYGLLRSDCTISRENYIFRGTHHLMYLINYNEMDGDTNEVCLEGGIVQNCGANFIFDNHQGRCRPIYCSKFQVQTSKGICINQMYKMLTGIIDILLQVSSPLDSDLTSDAKIVLAQKYFDKFIKPIQHLNVYPPYLMSVDRMPFPNSTIVLVTLIRVFVRPGDFENDAMVVLYERVKTLSDFSYYADGKHYKYNVEIASQFEWDQHARLVKDMRTNISLLNIFFESTSMLKGSFLRKQLFCPQIRLHENEVQDFVFKIVILSTNITLYRKEFQKVRPYMNESFEYIICADDYLPVIDCGNGGTAVLRPIYLREVIILVSASFIIKKQLM